MRTNSRLMGLAFGACLAALAAPVAGANSPMPTATRLAPATLPAIAKVEPRYQSYNVEMAEVVGGNFWKPYTAQRIAAMKAKSAAGEASAGVAGQDPTMFQARPPIDLSNPRLRKLTLALGPAYIRTSGTWANSVYFDDADDPASTTAPNGFDGVLTHQRSAACS